MAASLPISGRVSALATLAGLLFALVATSAAVAREAGPVLHPGQAAPAWRLPAPGGGSVVFPEVLEGRPAVLLFWATWCPYCKALMPHLQALRETYRGAGVQVIAVSVWEDGDPAAVVAREGFDFRLALNGDGVAWDYGVTGTPGLFVVDGKGKVILNRALADVAPYLPAGVRDRKPTPGDLAAAWTEMVRRALDSLPDGRPAQAGHEAASAVEPAPR